MKINIEEFRGLVESVAPVAAARSTMPILQCVRLYERAGELIAEATDLEVGIRDSVIADIDFDTGDDGFCVDAKRLSAILKVLDGELELSHDNGRLTIDDGAAQFILHTIPGEEFPPLPDTNGAEPVEIPGRLLQDAIRLVDFAISRDENRYVLNGLLLAFDGDTINIVATDGRRLAHVQVGDNADGAILRAYDGQKIVLPQKTTSYLAQVKNENLALILAENSVVVQIDETTLFSKTIEGRFPEWQKVVPAESNAAWSFNSDEAVGAIRRILLMTQPENPSMNCRIDPQRGIWRVEAGNDSGTASDEFGIQGDLDCGQIKMALNAQYFLEAIKAVKPAQIECRLQVKNGMGDGAIHMRNQDLHWQHILMPMRYQSINGVPDEEVAEAIGEPGEKIVEE